MNKPKVEVDSIVIGNHLKEKGLWMSLVLRPDVPFSMIPKFNLFIALGIRDAIQQFSNERVTIKWPNDIYIGNKKICGF